MVGKPVSVFSTKTTEPNDPRPNNLWVIKSFGPTVYRTSLLFVVIITLFSRKINKKI